MEKCNQCGRSEEEVRLYDGIYINEPVKICERCSLINGIPIIKMPSAEQLKESEKPYNVKSRLLRLAHLKPEEKKENPIYNVLKKLEEKPAAKEDLVFKLVDNFHWVIQTARRRRGLTQKQLAEAIAESEAGIRMLEKAIIPSSPLNLLRKLEQYLNVSLIKKDSFSQNLNQTTQVSGLQQVDKTAETRLDSQHQQLQSNVQTLNRQTDNKSDDMLSTKSAVTKKQALLSPSSFKKENVEKFTIGDLQRLSKKIEEDMMYVKKTKEEIGEEQFKNFGKEDTEQMKKEVYSNYEKKELKTRGEVPSIYDLMKKKEEKEKTSITGRDIQILDENLAENQHK